MSVGTNSDTACNHPFLFAPRWGDYYGYRRPTADVRRRVFKNTIPPKGVFPRCLFRERLIEPWLPVADPAGRRLDEDEIVAEADATDTATVSITNTSVAIEAGVGGDGDIRFE